VAAPEGISVPKFYPERLPALIGDSEMTIVNVTNKEGKCLASYELSDEVMAKVEVLAEKNCMTPARLMHKWIFTAIHAETKSLQDPA
jgi:hypothetical protein